MAIVLAAAVAAFAISYFLTGLMRRLSMRAQLIDVPNERSSHDKPIPRGGGLAIVAASILSFLVLYAAGVISSTLFLSAVGGGIAVSIVGLLDDRYSLAPGLRIVVHIAAAAWAVYCLGGLSSDLPVGRLLLPVAVGDVLAVLAVVWALNLFNFMDGIDGIAASEAVFVCAAGGLLTFLISPGAPVSFLAFVLSGACLGFLIWNWAPAKIFMGDAGSGYVGFVIAVLAVSSANLNAAALYVWTILGGVFICDATITLIRRLIRGELIYQAHRSHAYQILARRWNSHGRATLAVTLVNLAWLLPCAVFTALHPAIAPATTFIALGPVAILVFGLRAGASDAD